ncbi:MAG TPA: protein kinase [Gemmatimonadota bacterium]|nr:protein kinase [Gemmatimonadota bacterium]
MSVEERQRALDAVQDADLRAEVCALLSTHQELTSGNGGFLEGLDSVRASALLERSPTSGDPSTIGRYRIVRRLARGGMGVVYLAHDPRLERPVALKLLPPYLNADPTAVRRLGDEARAASALDHPHIETVYEIGEADDGRVFISMAYYDGETLRERIGRGPMAVPEVIDLGLQLARGLAAAHRSGIIHRDIKPENILVTGDGILKIVDFGVAKVMREGLASAGLPLGTAAYMSPEQTRGEALNHRTDLWSMGVVLYEMMAGARPFDGEGEALIHAIRNDPPRPLKAVPSGQPAALATIVGRCLEKDQKDRFDSADALAMDLSQVVRSAHESGAEAPGASAPRPRRRHARIAAAAAIPTVLIAAFLMRSDQDVPPLATGEAVAPGIAVLPFEVRGEDLGMWREGMVDLLSISLDGAAGLRAIDSRTVLARWGEAVHEQGAPDLESALEVARGTGARYAVMGSVVSSGSGMRLGAQIYALSDGASLATLQVEGPPDSLFALVDRLSIDLLAAIWQGRELTRENVDLTRITTMSLPALKAYLEGESLLRRGDFAGSVAAYERAIAADSTFAFALYHLGMAYGWVGDPVNQNQSYRRALRHAGRLPEREALLLRATLEYHTVVLDHRTVVRLLQEATRKYPDDPDAWYFLGESYWHGGEQLLSNQDESEKAFRIVVELDPGFAPAYIHLVNNAFIRSPDSARASRLIEAYRRHAPNSSSDQDHQIAFGLAFGDSTRRRQAYAALDTLPPGNRLWLAEGYLDHPRFWDTRRIVLERQPRPRAQPGPRMTGALFDTNLSQGRLQAALAYLEDPLMSPGYRAAGLYKVHSTGLPVARVALDRALAPPRTESMPADMGSTLIWFYAGAYAADQGRSQDHATAVDRLRAEADRLLAEGDSAGSRFARGAALALSGQGLWRRGDSERALQRLMEGQRLATWSESPSREAVNETIRWWLGELLLEMKTPQEAVLYYESFWNDPLAAHRLGGIYERIGDPAKARAAYSLVASAWSDADPELRVRAGEAHAAVQRLTSLAGE